VSVIRERRKTFEQKKIKKKKKKRPSNLYTRGVGAGYRRLITVITTRTHAEYVEIPLIKPPTRVRFVGAYRKDRGGTARDKSDGRSFFADYDGFECARACSGLCGRARDNYAGGTRLVGREKISAFFPRQFRTPLRKT